MTNYKIFLDDIRMPRDVTWVEMPLGPWIIIRSYREFTSAITRDGVPTFVSFDHDLAEEHYLPEVDPKTYSEKTGYDCAKWLVNYCMNHNIPFPDYQVHSMNPIGKQNIVSYIENYKRSCT